MQLRKKNGIKTILLTGDQEETGKSVFEQLQLDEYHAELLPEEKVKKLEEILKDSSSLGKVAFVGDGINDAPALARSDVGIAMGGLGSDCAIEAADVVFMEDKPSKILTAMKISYLRLQ